MDIHGDSVPNKGPGLPRPNPGLSFWQQTTRSFHHINANQTEPAPAEAKYVVIGSGISGALVTFELIEGGVPAQDILILEAREAASGASSRNAGHVRPDAFRGYQVYQKLHGKEQALKIIANERLVFQKVGEFVEKHEVDCDFNPTTTLDVCLTREFAEFNAQSFKEYQEAGGDLSHVKFYEGDDAKRRTRIPETVTAYEWPAGSSHPAKLAQWLLSASIKKGTKLFTHCPAISVSQSLASTEGETLWDITTPRGTVTASTVIHCTNAFAAHLLPHLSSLVTPNRVQAHAIVPPSSLNGSNMLTSTMSLRHSLKHFYSVAQRQPDGVIILGSALRNPNLSKETFDNRLIPDDSAFSAEIRDDAMKNFEACFPSCAAENLNHGEGLWHSWSGVIGLTTDSVPFIGKIEGSPGQWVCAGFNGHGMARIFTCAPGLAKLVLGGTWEDTGLPECFEPTESRLEKLRKGVSDSVF